MKATSIKFKYRVRSIGNGSSLINCDAIDNESGQVLFSLKGKHIPGQTDISHENSGKFNGNTAEYAFCCDMADVLLKHIMEIAASQNASFESEGFFWGADFFNGIRNGSTYKISEVEK